jgi:hypothetical protein
MPREIAGLTGWSRAGRKQGQHASGSVFAKEGMRFSRDKKIATALAQCRLLVFSF